MARTRSKRITLWLTPEVHADLLDASHAAGVPACRYVETMLAARRRRRVARSDAHRISSALAPVYAGQPRLFEPPAAPDKDAPVAAPVVTAAPVQSLNVEIVDPPTVGTLFAQPAAQTNTNYVFREEWMDELTARFRESFFNGDLLPELPRVRLSCGFPKGSRNAVGQCWNAKCSKDETFEIFIHPSVSNAEEVAHILLHELIHAAVGLECKHRGAFKKAATTVGLEGPMRATVPGDELKAKLYRLTKPLGAYPHAELVAKDGPKKEGTRMLKLECPGCGMVIRTTKKWIETTGAPTCACGCEEPFAIEEK